MKSPTEWFAAIPVRMLRSPTYRQLTALEMRVVNSVIARQFGRGEWKFTATELAREAQGSVPSVRRAVRKAQKLGILVVTTDRHRSGANLGWVLSVPDAVLQERASFDQGGDHAGAPLPYIEKEDQKDPPNPPREARGACTQRRAARTKVVVVDGAAVDLARIADPKLRRRDERKVEAIREDLARADADAQAAAQAADVRRARRDEILADPLARCDRLLLELRDAIDTCGLEHDHPARVGAEHCGRDGERARFDSGRGLTENDDLSARDSLVDWCTHAVSMLATLTRAADAHQSRIAMLAPYQREAAVLREAAFGSANVATRAAVAARLITAPASGAVRRAQDAVDEAYRRVSATEDAAQAEAAVDTLRVACAELDAAAAQLHQAVAQAPPPKTPATARPGFRRN